MPRFEVTIDIRAPAPTVFAGITDPKRSTEWNPNIVEISNLIGYPVSEGSTWDQVVVVNGLRIRLQCRIAEYKPPHYGLLRVSGGNQAEIVTQCERIDDTTRVTQIIDFVMPGGKLGQLASGLVKGQVQREVQRGLERQRDTLERESREGHGPSVI
ncbi:MAG: SRPBCC family protein [Chloroflexota bacterium]|nr:MAG: hypothetical protein DLM70_09835 [Chloroflexota bacterium]